MMPLQPDLDDARLKHIALEYTIRLYRELSMENSAPPLGTENQVVEFILEHPDLREAVMAWGLPREPFEASVRPPEILPQDDLYLRVREQMCRTMDVPPFIRTSAPPHGS